MKLIRLIENIEIEDIAGDIEKNINYIHYDSRKIKTDSLFICIKGFNSDGHSFIDTAVKNGAVAVLIEEEAYRYKNKYKNVTFIKIKDTRKSMATIASNFFNKPTDKLKVIGVTGTNGKTSVTTFLKDILDTYNNTGLIGTIKIYDGKNEIISNNTTPESVDLQNHFNNMILNNCKYCAMEVSSHSLALNRVNDVNFSIGIFTNLTPDHLDFHKDLNEYRNTKELLFHKTNTANIINIDDAGGEAILSKIVNLKTPYYTYSINKTADFMAKDIELRQDGVCYRLVTPEYESNIYVPVPGKFTVYNTLSAIAACYILNIPIDVVKTQLKQSSGVAGRFENIKNDKGISIIVDYAHTPDALENILLTAKEFAKGRIITVFGCGGDRDKTKRPLMGKIVHENSDFIVVTNDNPRTENDDLIIEDIIKGMNMDKEYLIIKDRKKAIYKAIEEAKENDVVMIVGKGHEDYQIIGDTKYHFDDKEIAKEAILKKV